MIIVAFVAIEHVFVVVLHGNHAVFTDHNRRAMAPVRGGVGVGGGGGGATGRTASVDSAIRQFIFAAGTLLRHHLVHDKLISDGVRTAAMVCSAV